MGCCGLGGNNQTLSGTVVSENCQNVYQVEDSGRNRRNIEEEEENGDENLGHYGLSNKFHDWKMRFAVSEAEKQREQEQNLLRETRLRELHCIPGKDEFCSCDPYLNELGFSTIALLGGLSFGNILILILRNIFEACCGKKKNKKDAGKEE